MNLNLLLKSGKKLLVKHLPEFMTGASIGFTYVAIASAFKEGPQITEALDEAKSNSETGKIPAKETVKIVLKNGKKTFSAAAASTALSCIGIHTSIKRTNTAMISSMLLEDAYMRYRDATEDVVGKKKVKEIEERIPEKRLEALPDSTMDMLAKCYAPTPGKQIWLEPVTGQPMVISYEEIDAVKNRINETINSDYYISAAEYLDMLPIEFPSEIEHYEHIGWNQNVKISKATRWTQNGLAVASYDFNIPPHEDFDKLYS